MVSTMLKEVASVVSAYRRECLTHRLYQSLSATGFNLSQEAFDLREGLPTFICVVQVRILDDAHGAEDGLRMLAA